MNPRGCGAVFDFCFKSSVGEIGFDDFNSFHQSFENGKFIKKASVPESSIYDEKKQNDSYAIVNDEFVHKKCPFSPVVCHNFELLQRSHLCFHHRSTNVPRSWSAPRTCSFNY